MAAHSILADARTIREVRAAVSRKRCLHPDAPAGCSKIGRAHTIQRAAALERIAREGHVYTSLIDPPHAFAGGQVPIRLIGIRQASAFAGFCARHDDELFSALEKTQLAPEPKQVFLAHFRALAFELYQKAATLEVHRVLQRRFGEKQLSREQQEVVASMIEGTSQGLTDVRFQKHVLDEDLRAGRFDQIQALFCRLDSVPKQVCCGAFAPEWDVEGHPLLDLANAPPDQSEAVGLTISADTAGGYVLLTGHRAAKNADAFLRRVLATAQHRLANLIFRLALQQIENVVFAPDWLEGVIPAVREEVERRAHSGQDFDLFNQPLQAPVGWRVTSIQHV